MTHMVKNTIKNTIENLTEDEYNLCLLRKKFVKMYCGENNHIILDISKNNLGDWHKKINFKKLEGILIFFTFGHNHMLFDYTPNKLKPLFI